MKEEIGRAIFLHIFQINFNFYRELFDPNLHFTHKKGEKSKEKKERSGSLEPLCSVC